MNNTTTNKVRPVLFGGVHFNKAINDDNFFKLLPQFLPIRAKISAMHVDLNSKKGCSSCKQRRVQNTLEQDFAGIVANLDAESGKVFRDYFGVPRMLIHAINPTTRAAYLKDI